MSSPSDMPANQVVVASRSKVLWLCVLFGGLYFVQGIVEPTEGLLSQPLRSLQDRWGRTTEQLATFATLIAIPWTLKPLFGLLIDFVPFWGLGKRGYLLLCSVTISIVFVTLFVVRGPLESSGWLLPLVVTCTMAVAMSDVAVDALMVEQGQPLGLTGKLQSVQWSCIYLASFIAGPLGGEFSHRGLHGVAFLVAAALSMAGFLLVVAWRPTSVPVVKERVEPIESARGEFSLWATLAFLVLWNFNPFSSAVQYSFMKNHLDFDDRFIGFNTSAFAAGAFIASIAYGTYCRRVNFRLLVQLSVVAGVLATLAYLGMVGQTSAIVVSVASGVAYMTGSLIQLDLAARACPVKWAGTVFSSLMAASNFSILASTYLGGWFFTLLETAWTPQWTFRWLVLLGAACSSGCWLLINRLVPRKHAPQTPPTVCSLS